MHAGYRRTAHTDTVDRQPVAQCLDPLLVFQARHPLHVTRGKAG
ncbi:hypothetical protein [Pseudomonas sp. SDI]|nr:hypothetical protein [Pseudomonas sp. SDI]